MMRVICGLGGLCAILATLAVATGARAQASAHAMVVAGRAGHVGGGTFDCATSGPQARELAFFNTGVGLPSEGYAYCGLAGGIQNLTGATASGVAHQDATAAFNGGVVTVSADAKATIGSLGVRASGSSTAESFDGFNYGGAEGAAYYSDAVTFDGTGTAKMLFQFAVDGSAALTGGRGQTLTLLNYQIGSPLVYGAFTAITQGSDIGYVRNNTGSGENPLAGFTVGSATLSGAGTAYSFVTDIALGVPTDMTIGLYAAAYPGFFGGTADNDFFSTARLSGISFVDGAGNILDRPVTGLGSSGYQYDSTGAHLAAAAAVPEPASWAMAIVGLGLTGAMLRASRRRPSALTA